MSNDPTNLPIPPSTPVTITDVRFPIAVDDVSWNAPRAAVELVDNLGDYAREVDAMRDAGTTAYDRANRDLYRSGGAS